LDLDRFKQVNDTHGHLVGSRLLAEVGGLMKRVLGPENSCFRYGGDEFCALLPGQGKQQAIDTTMHLWEALRMRRASSAVQGLSSHAMRAASGWLPSPKTETAFRRSSARPTP
jgi:diguanylate cyclase (GGDEF)-like protein